MEGRDVVDERIMRRVESVRGLERGKGGQMDEKDRSKEKERGEMDGEGW